MEQQINSQPDPSKIMQIGMGFWASKVMLSAVKFKVFTLLAGTSKSAKDIKETLQLNTTDRHVYDWLDTLVSLDFLKRDGLSDKAMYSNTRDTEIFLDTNKPSYIGGILQMANNRLYPFWANLEEALITGRPQNESKDGSNMDFFEILYKSPEKLQEFMDAMSGIQIGNFMTLVNKFNFGNYKTMADIGGADGTLAVMVAMHHKNIYCTTYDLPPVAPLAEAKFANFNLSDRVKFISGDFLNDPIPSAEVIIMGNILHGL
ncbi:MAG: methyltransferase, partial [Ginsengibacter sp.]